MVFDSLAGLGVNNRVGFDQVGVGAEMITRGIRVVGDIIGLEGAYKNFIDSAKKHLIQGFVGRVVLFEQGGGVREGLAFADNGGCGCSGSDDGGGDRVDQRDESRQLGRRLKIGCQVVHLRDWIGPRRN